ncbi:SDR family NAD(P)-dependent oxidoreductase [Roseomonas sp. 18066]|uniref:SDR family NAD(P)-dependent oxidoreductase n=1 Tax=Roseomonas sp. 18066 TaxID=2681412 RepID=UPI00135A51E0|nr:SDR family oxidoreductase [Roseomonas sp. 18066]
MDLGLNGKCALVTGGARGIGRAIAVNLLAEGARVAFCSRSAEPVREAERQLREAAGADRVFGFAADVATPEGAAGFVADSAAALGGIDLLVANVGGNAGGYLEESSHADWQRTFALNLFHAVDSIRAVVPFMRQRGGGSIVVVASISGWKPGGKAQYATAKAAEIQLAASLAPELAADRIRINTVSPGSILYEGGGWDRRMQREPAVIEDFIAREFPEGRMGSAEEIADVVTFALSRRASWMNGAHIPVDGAQGRPSIG